MKDNFSRSTLLSMSGLTEMKLVMIGILALVGATIAPPLLAQDAAARLCQVFDAARSHA